MKNTILVAGFDREDNTIVRMVLDYGFHATHMAVDSGSVSIPKCKAAIICTFNISHPFSNRVRKEYDDLRRPILYAKGGASSIRDEFEKQFIEPTKVTLSKLPKKYQVVFLLAFLYHIDEGFKTHEFLKIIKMYGAEITEGYLSVMMAELIKDKTVTRETGRGKYTFRGVGEQDAEVLHKKSSCIIPPHWKQKPLKTPEPELLTVKEIPQIPTPEVEPPRPIVSAEFEQRIEGMFQKELGRMWSRIDTLTRQVDTISHAFNPDTREIMIRDITEKLNRMSASKLLKVKSMFDLLDKE